jgi:hypothetical protein
MKRSWVLSFIIAVFVLSPGAGAQTATSNASPATGCPVELRDLHGDSVRIKLKNTSGKKIVGLVFNVALSDATERWMWLHWDYDPGRRLREFGWTKPIKDGETKKLNWDWTRLEHEHGGGFALVLTSILFEDGSSWEDDVNSATCMQIWYNNHKKGFTRPVELPRRE